MTTLSESLKFRMSEDERALLERTAADERRSLASVTRIAVVRYCQSREAGAEPAPDLPDTAEEAARG